MANITEILGTDSLSSSRLTLNSNFTALNDEIADITALIDPVTATISGIDSISAEQITLTTINGGGTTQILNIDSTSAVFNVVSQFSSDIIMQRAVIKSGTIGSAIAGSSNVTPGFATLSTFFANVDFQLPIGINGQEVTIISTNAVGIVISNGGGTLAVTNLALNGLNSTVTLKCFSNIWYIVGFHDITWS